VRAVSAEDEFKLQENRIGLALSKEEIRVEEIVVVLQA
jgi:CRISPR/Cas system CMR-associated protein Cmr3 (group 5 of RAMP superfamily)